MVKTLLLMAPQFVKIVLLVNTVVVVAHVMQHHACQDINALMEVCKHAFLGSIHREMLHVKNALTENGLHLEVHTVTVLQLIVVKDTSAIVGTEVHVEMENTVTQVQYTVISA